MSPAAVLALAVLACAVAPAAARVNATGAIDVFLISDCGTCTSDKNSIFCTQASGDDKSSLVDNTTLTVTIYDKKNGKPGVCAGTFAGSS